MDYCKEVEGKGVHDPFNKNMTTLSRCVWVPYPVIIGAGPSGLATAACLKQRGISSLILERENFIASLWKLKTYDRLRLHLPKHFYPVFNKTVVSAEFDHRCGFWRIKTLGLKHEETEYVSRWLIVATGENAEEVVPKIEGMDDFSGPILHTSSYKSGRLFRGKDVLVVGCGNSGMEVCLDLCNCEARPSLVVRASVHVLPQEMLGRSTFGLSMWLLKWFPVRIVDRLLLLLSRFTIGDTGKFGLHRPQLGPLELKSRSGKTPVLDVGTLDKIKSGNIKVYPGIKRITYNAAEFVDGTKENFDAIILATGYKSNVPQWLKDRDLFSEKDGLPREPFPNGWKGECGLYAVGFTKRGLLGSSLDAKKDC
ncbi:hypothetical protein GOBAR_DD01872 [Gossypium barbadense]|nr:hypothetical protein GOBAR_DD01872 [Gossypium barbadense]